MSYFFKYVNLTDKENENTSSDTKEDESTALIPDENTRSNQHVSKTRDDHDLHDEKELINSESEF